MGKAQLNDTVKVHYTGKLTSGEVFDSSLEADPLEFTIGGGMLIPAFEQAVIGMAPDETRVVNISSDEAYGPVLDELVQQVPRNVLPEDMNPVPGQELVSENENGEQLIVVVKEVNDTHVTIDANHPLAGKDLTFEIRLVEIA